MPWIIYILIAILLILILPIPIEIKLIYKDNIFQFYIYNFEVNLKKRTKKKIKRRTANAAKKSKKIDFDSAKLILHKIDCAKFKPTLKMNMKIKLGTGDASYTGISCGALYYFSPIIYRILEVIFKIKSYNFDVKPDFDNLSLNTYINSIIFVSFAKIIYMLILLINSVKVIKKSYENK